MGGNALKAVNTQRLDKKEFEICEKKVIDFLKINFPTALVDSIPSYFEKKDFGDLDVLISEEGLNQHGGIEKLIEKAKEAFFSRQEVANGHVLSFEYRNSPLEERGFQVDVLQMPAVTFDFARNYFAFNDLGNLIGRSAHKMGLKFGHNGLWYVMRNGDHKLADILLSRNFDKSLTFLGFESERFRQGFQNLEDVYQYVGKSKYFNGDIYLLENQSYKSRIRDKKRPTYQQFLAWIRDNNAPNRFEYPSKKDEWLPLMFKEFPNFKEDFMLTLAQQEKIMDVKSKFNSEIMSEWTGKTGQALGYLTTVVKEKLGDNENMLNILHKKSKEEIKEFVLEVEKTLDFSGYKTVSPDQQAIIDARKIRQEEKKQIKKAAALKNK